jgi:hypothetical protein
MNDESGLASRGTTRNACWMVEVGVHGGLLGSGPSPVSFDHKLPIQTRRADNPTGARNKRTGLNRTQEEQLI